MAPTQRKKRPRGRPKSTAETRADGERLNTALQFLGWSQAEAARRSGIRQQWINGVVNGQRALGREDLRALARAGIPSDFLLGIACEFVPAGGTRTIRGLAQDVAAHVTREVMPRVNQDPTVQDILTGLLGGVDLLRPLVQLVLDEWNANPWLETRLRIARVIDSLPNTKECSVARAELQRAYREAKPTPGRLFDWKSVTFRRTSPQKSTHTPPKGRR